jgi:hypothetical protein
MIIRDATFADMAQLMPLAREAHLRSVFADIKMNEAALQRSFVTAIQFDGGFAKVIENKGRVTGGMVGVLMVNHMGIKCAVDLFTYAKGGTDMLIRSFRAWAKAGDAKFVQLTDLSDNRQYQTLLTGLGLQSGGTNFIGVM